MVIAESAAEAAEAVVAAAAVAVEASGSKLADCSVQGSRLDTMDRLEAFESEPL